MLGDDQLGLVDLLAYYVLIYSPKWNYQVKATLFVQRVSNAKASQSSFHKSIIRVRKKKINLNKKGFVLIITWEYEALTDEELQTSLSNQE